MGTVTALVFALVISMSVSLSAVEAAYYLVKRRKLGHLSGQNPRAELVNRYLDDPAALLMPIQLGTYTAHVGLTAALISVLLDVVGHWSILLAFGLMIAYLLVFRLTLPYALVRKSPERSLLLMMPAFDVYARSVHPVVGVLRKRGAPEPGVAHEGEPSGVHQIPELPPPPVQDSNEVRLVDSVARFSETQVREVMTPRPDVVAIPERATVEDLRRLMRETKYSRIPVYRDNLDDIVGVVGVRDLVEFDGDPAGPMAPLVRPAYLVPETKRISDLLKELQARRSTFAVVIDEYGGTAGLVSVEDIVEELVGEIKDEFDVEAEPITVEADGSVVAAGRVSVDRLQDALETRLCEDEDVETVGGLVATVFGRIPRPGDNVCFRGFEIEVIDAEKKRVNRARFRRVPSVNEEP
jgi:putative hemolysin